MTSLAETKTTLMHDTIAVVDFGGQYAHLIATKIRQANVKAEILLPEDDISKFAGFKGIVLSGGAALISSGESGAEDGGRATDAILDLGVPVLGICFGHQTIASRYGGEVTHGGNVEWGFSTLHLTKAAQEHPLFEGLEPMQTVWMSHFDTVTSLGDGFVELGYTQTTVNKEEEGTKTTATSNPEKRGPNAAIANDALQRYGFQFHVEVDSTVNGERMLKNFVCNICGCQQTWKVDDHYLETTLDEIRKEVNGRGVFLLASGGVDSTVAAKLFQLALPKVSEGGSTGRWSTCGRVGLWGGGGRRKKTTDGVWLVSFFFFRFTQGKLKLLHIDNGMMRKDESAEGKQRLRGWCCDSLCGPSTDVFVLFVLFVFVLSLFCLCLCSFVFFCVLCVLCLRLSSYVFVTPLGNSRHLFRTIGTQ